ncbi:transcription initiation factor TFIIA large subunit [Sporothrix schenckii 1099-18]|uniref:Transcription initiation factor TFIIA large subunit n=1 Tax=Sporothrix schenckii 1099-18 TaxID=1397361 RepID=A0A0F2MA49_SPOSC|nr:transcription initiation factor TFIIA large subunit [Sporothrix schenckii 1099-18]KJR85949.1 transcription initiation factor TFIIA large subunit [Sporothrix schenckii 1099-18]
MSNNVVGSVYEQIIEDVLSTSRVDFEENGVDEGVLDELRRSFASSIVLAPSRARRNVFRFSFFSSRNKCSRLVSVSFLLLFVFKLPFQASCRRGLVAFLSPHRPRSGGQKARREGRGGWQRKLTQFNVAQFPWDPKPESEATASNGAAAASSGGKASGKDTSPPTSTDNSFSQPTMSPLTSQSLSLPSLPMPAFEPAGIKTEDSTQSSGGHRIKTEPDAQHSSGLTGVPAAGSHMPLPNAPPFPSAAGGPDSAAMRAAAMLSKEFGSAANASINAMNTQQQQQQQRPVGGQLSSAQQYRAQMSAQAAAQLTGANGVARSQVDGSADDGAEDSADASLFEGVLLQQQRAGQPPVELGRMEIDNLLHEQMARRAKQMEGGGLMLPLQQASQRQARQRRAAAAATAAVPAAPAASQPRAATSMAQLDGIEDGDDDDVKADILDDEDAINSDLDDPEDDREDEDDEDDVMGPIMLCVYDKVQRVKNKWKCTLKDGVLTVNGKEYVFHKATGEYEW